MSEPFRILGVSGSLRRGSYNRAVLRAAQRLVPDGTAIETFDGIGELPFYSEDEEGELTPDAVLAFRQRIDEADAVLIVTPEYNGSLPGVLKNALDWSSRPFGNTAIVGKPALVIGASTSPFGATWAQEHTRKALQLSGARPYEVGHGVGKVADLLDDDGELAHLETEVALSTLLGEFVSWARSPVAVDDF